MTRRLLLINPAHIVDGRRHLGPARFPIPPLNLGAVAALTPPGWDIHISDENQRRTEVNGWQPDLVGITVVTPTAPRAYELSRWFRARGATVVLGGVHPSTLPEEAIQYADSVVVGDAESAWPEVVADHEAGRLRTIYRGEYLPLAGLPHPRRDLYPTRYFAEVLITSKGCTNRCDFCSIWKFNGQRYRQRPIDEVVDELSLIPRRKVVFFADDNLTVDRRRTIDLCKHMVDRGIRRTYAIQGTLGLADDSELLSWLARSGCAFVFVGLESLSQDTVARIGKPDLVRMGVGGFRQRITRIHEQGMAVFGSFILGLDGDTPAIFDQIRRFTLSASVDCTLLNILTPTPGTAVFDRLREQGRLLYTDFPADYALYAQDNVSFLPDGMTAAELQAGTRDLIASLTRLPVALRRAHATWRATRSPLATMVALGWNFRGRRGLRHFPLRDVPATLA